MHSYRDSEGSRDCIPCHISQKVRFSRVLSSRAILALLKVHNRLYLINSSEADDHTGGNAAYGDLPIIAHESTRREMIKWLADPKTLVMWHDYQAATLLSKIAAICLT